jgi:hypothetical protein
MGVELKNAQDQSEIGQFLTREAKAFLQAGQQSGAVSPGALPKLQAAIPAVNDDPPVWENFFAQVEAEVSGKARTLKKALGQPVDAVPTAAQTTPATGQSANVGGAGLSGGGSIEAPVALKASDTISAAAEIASLPPGTWYRYKTGRAYQKRN